MSELILTEEERKAAWCDCDNKTLADILRHCLVVTESIKSKEQNLSGLNAASDGLSLIRMMHEANLTTLTLTQSTVMIGNEDIGDYEITVRRVNRENK